ncbi:hypothetical protein BDZ89DRAFT_950239 [Hymenopellis radicata]|nr:hypothetical protein BDZ89DRAFT_950239 [Hymenopellis radicata]
METLKGLNRGSYLWGKSIHNIRIERLWRDVTLGFGAKWKYFFQELEQSEGLNANIPAHIWLLHHLFLDAINADALLWAEAWNGHTLSLPRQHIAASLKELFVFGMMENGLRGMDEILSSEELDGYGVDWEEMEDRGVSTHHQENNLADSDDALNPFLMHRPEHFSHVEVEASESPFTSAQVNLLDQYLSSLDIYSRQDMDSRRQLWRSAVYQCGILLDQ